MAYLLLRPAKLLGFFGAKYRKVSFRKLSKLSGTLPDKEFDPRFNVIRFVSVPMPLGMDPLKLLF